MARRGGVKRISSTIYDEVREAIKHKIKLVSHFRHTIYSFVDQRVIDSTRLYRFRGTCQPEK